MNGQNIKEQRNDFFSNFILGIFNNRELPFQRRERLESAALDIKKYLENKETADVPEIMREFNINAIDALAAIKILKEKGIIRED